MMYFMDSPKPGRVSISVLATYEQVNEWNIGYFLGIYFEMILQHHKHTISAI